ncbi:hypothetical protein RJT34_27508 [Clitoria ternatea]|uniref:Uncharacterized protein n=1 Tax=Clitoria ternatea TaxID=43366 RepID=A0AAN9FGM1_CLITE
MSAVVAQGKGFRPVRNKGVGSGMGKVREATRERGEGRVTPQSNFKIPHLVPQLPETQIQYRFVFLSHRPLTHCRRLLFRHNFLCCYLFQSIHARIEISLNSSFLSVLRFRISLPLS